MADGQVVLRTARLLLVPLAQEHLECEIELDSDPEVMRLASVGLRFVRSFHPDVDDPLPGSEHGEVEHAITWEQWSSPT